MNTGQQKIIGDTILPSAPLTRSYIHATSHETLLYTTLGQLLDEACDECPDHEAFVLCDTSDRLTYEQIRKKALSYAKGFLSIGLQKGDIICLAGVTNSDWLHLFFAAAYIGLVIIVAPMIKEYDVIYGIFVEKVKIRLTVIGPRDNEEVSKGVCKVFFEEGCKHASGHSVEFIFCQSGEFEKSEVVTKRKIKSLSDLEDGGSNVSGDALQNAIEMVSPEDPYILLPTSGSTGLPKLVTWKQGTICNFGKFNFRSKIPGKAASVENPGIIATFNVWVDEMVVTCFLAICTFHKNRARVVCLPGSIRDDNCDVETCVLKVLEQERCTHCCLWPAFYIDLLSSPNFDKYDLSCLRGGLVGSQRCSPELFEKMFKVFPELIHTYGGTEPNLITCTTADYPSHTTRLETVGHPIPFYEVKITDENGQVVPVETPGEILCKGWCMFHSYWGEAELTENAFRDGWYITGDIGVMNSEGILRIMGRTGDALRFKRFGDVVYPGPIEKVLNDHPKVKSAQVVGVPDDYAGVIMVACIILEDDQTASAEELKSYCSKNLTLELWVPDKFIFMEKFPRVGIRNKISKKKLREMVGNIVACE